MLSLNHVSYSFPQSHENALEDISFSVKAGEYIALVGTNGSGKTTLSRLLAGFIKPDSGSLCMDADVLPGIVFQQPKEQIVAGVVERDTAFGPQNLSLPKSEIELRTIECLSVVGMADRASSRTFELSLGQTQRLAFSGILALFPDLLILDEVTAMLDPRARKELVEFIDQWNTRGHTIIHVTHDEDEVLRAHRVLVMDRGKLVFDGSSRDFKKDTGLFEKVFPSLEIAKNKNQETENNETVKETALCAEGLSFSYPDREIFSDLNFTLEKGSLVALTGPSGCGKSTLLECLAGLHDDMKGNVFSKTRPVLSLQESDAALFASCAADDVAFGPENQGVKGKALLSRVKESMKLVQLPFNEFADRNTFGLSGGEKRKLSLAGIIALESDVYLFDEPTSALDAASRNAVLSTLRSLADSGKTVLFSTHRMEEAEIADREIKWESLIHHENTSEEKNEQSEKKSEELKEQKPFENAAMNRKLAAVSASLMAPAKVPVSPVSILPPLAKWLLFLAIAIASSVVQEIWLCGLMFAVNVLYVLLARYPLKKPLSALWKLLPWILVFALLGIVLLPLSEGDRILWSWKIFAITDTKIFLLARAFLRAASLIFSMGTFLFTTGEREIMDGISMLLYPLSLIKIPVRYAVLVVGIIFRFLPLLLDEMCGIVKTQMVRGSFGKAKGLSKIKKLLPLFVPLMLQTFRKAEQLSDALTARYFK